MGEEIGQSRGRGLGEPVIIRDRRSAPWRDLYYHALRLGWPGFLLWAAAIFLIVNVIFAALYSVQPSGISDITPGSFSQAFFFSVQTLATIGYGRWAPVSTYSNTVVTAEVLVGLLLVAMFAGLTFSRFARPTARIAFSRVMVVTGFEGVPTLMLRIANVRGNQIVEARVSLSLLRDETTAEGRYIRRLHDLRLVRERSPVLGLTFQIMHRIDAESPLSGYTAERMAENGVEIVAVVAGLDETSVQTVHARQSYPHDRIQFGRRFTDVFSAMPEGRLAIDMRVFHDSEPDEAA